jgi:hypothetical protein
MVVPRLNRKVRSPVLTPRMNKAVKRMISQKDFFGINNLPVEMDPDKSPSRRRETRLWRWHPTPSGDG